MTLDTNLEQIQIGFYKFRDNIHHECHYRWSPMDTLFTSNWRLFYIFNPWYCTEIESWREEMIFQWQAIHECHASFDITQSHETCYLYRYIAASPFYILEKNIENKCSNLLELSNIWMRTDEREHEPQTKTQTWTHGQGHGHEHNHGHDHEYGQEQEYGHGTGEVHRHGHNQRHVELRTWPRTRTRTRPRRRTTNRDTYTAINTDKDKDTDTDMATNKHGYIHRSEYSPWHGNDYGHVQKHAHGVCHKHGRGQGHGYGHNQGHKPGASFQLFLGGQIFKIFFNATGQLKNWKKQPFTCSNLTLFIVPFVLFSLFFLFFLFIFLFFFFSFSLKGGKATSPQPLKWRLWHKYDQNPSHKHGHKHGHGLVQGRTRSLPRTQTRPGTWPPSRTQTLSKPVHKHGHMVSAAKTSMATDRIQYSNVR